MTAYRCIVADPPWPIAWKGGGATRTNGRGERHVNLKFKRDLPYERMSIGSVQTWKFPYENGARAHSRKPDGALDLIERASPGPRLEMFARRARFGWDYWGDESLGTAVMP